MPFRRSLIFVVAAMALLACGFKPAYGPTGTGAALRDMVSVRAPGSAVEFEFVSRVEARLGTSSSPTYELDYVLNSLGVSGDAAGTRLIYRGAASWSLIDLVSQKQVAGGPVNGAIARSTSSSFVSTYVSEQDVNRRMAIYLADKVLVRLLALDLKS